MKITKTNSFNNVIIEVALIIYIIINNKKPIYNLVLELNISLSNVKTLK